MKNLSLVLASLVLFAGVSFAKPVVKKQAAPAKTEKKETKKTSTTKSTKTEKKTETKKAAK